MQGQKWGRLSAGFAGGRAFGQVWQGEDNFQAAMCGAVAGGVFAATSLADIPSSVGTFVMFSYFIEKLTANSKAQAQGSGGDRRRPPPPARYRPVQPCQAEPRTSPSLPPQARQGRRGRPCASRRPERQSAPARVRKGRGVSRQARGWTGSWGFRLRRGARRLQPTLGAAPSPSA